MGTYVATDDGHIQPSTFNCRGQDVPFRQWMAANQGGSAMQGG